MSANAWLECRRCKFTMELAAYFTGCPNCLREGIRFPLEVGYRNLPAQLEDTKERGIWKWRDWLPSFGHGATVTLQEGGTPLIEITAPGIEARLLLKNETVNPTWSWKDRPNPVSISAARHFGYKKVFVISTGNHGNAAAAYSARAGLACTVFCHQDAPDLQVALMRGYGATVVRGGDRDALARELLARGEHFPGSILCPRAGFSNPFGVEGFKTIAFELVADLGKAPDRVFVPTGSGDGIYGIWKGFRELRDAGVITQVPRMVACQAKGADSAVRAFHCGTTRVQELDSVTTAALSVGETVTGDHSLRAVFESNGEARAVDDNLLREACRALARQGVSVELSSATALACAATLGGGEKETWVVLGSGASVKWPEEVIRNYL